MKSKWAKIIREEFMKERGRLNLNSKGIRDTDIPGIIEACQRLQTQIKQLNLDLNQIGAEGAKHLSAANFPKLTRLSLACVLIKYFLFHFKQTFSSEYSLFYKQMHN